MALGVTLAPFAAPEKPDLSPAAAVSFSKDAVSYTRAGFRKSCLRHPTQPAGETLLSRNILILLNIFPGRIPARAQEADPKSLLTCSRRIECCCSGVEQRCPVGSDLRRSSQICNSRSGSGEPRGTFRTHKAFLTNQSQSLRGALPKIWAMLALFRYLQHPPNWPSIRALTSRSCDHDARLDVQPA